MKNEKGKMKNHGETEEETGGGHAVLLSHGSRHNIPQGFVNAGIEFDIP
jgi:hypothetical protein